MTIVSGIQQDVAYALRGLARSPGFTAALVLTMAVGVGGNVATLSTLDRLLFQAPPGLADPGAVRRIYARERFRHREPIVTASFSMPDVSDFASVAGSSARIAGYASVANRVIGDDGPRVTISYITSDFFSLAGIRPTRGRFFTPDESALVPISPEPAVLSADLWRRAFASDSAILGRRFTLNAKEFIIVGIAPREFRGLDTDPVDLWAPVSARLDAAGEPWVSNRDARFLSVVARIGPRSDWNELVGHLTLRSTQVHRTDPWFDASNGVITAPLLMARGPIPLGRLTSRNLSLAERLGAVSLAVLLVTTGNVAMLLLMRTIRRRREIAVRLALGMSRRRLVVQLLTESLLLAAAAGGAALVLGWWSSTLLQSRLLSTIRTSASVIGHRSVVLAAVLAALVGLAAGLVPAIASRRYSVNALRLDPSSIDPAGSRARALLLGTQTALCVLLIAFAGAFLQSLRRAATSDLGFDREHLITIVAPVGSADVLPELMTAVGSLPWARSVANAMTDVAPNGARGAFAIHGEPPLRDDQWPSFNAVDAKYFQTVGLNMVRGRPLSERDVRGAEPVVVITESMAAALWHGHDALGACVYPLGDVTRCRTVVGIVRDVRWDLAAPPSPHYYVPIAQMSRTQGRNSFVRTRDVAGAAEIADVDRIARSLVPDVAARPRAYIASELLEPQLKPLRAASLLFLVFGVVALISAAAGIYGLVSYDLAQRTRELGIRLALGAASRDVVRVVVTSGLQALSVGVGVGLVAAVASQRLIAAFLVDTSPVDPVVLGLVVLTVFLASVLAVITPALRAARVDPVIALRAD
jgi:putative ABC transport system permease protein